MKQLRVYREDTLLWPKVHVARSFFQRLIGLLNRSSLDKSEGLLFYKAPAIHTIGMRFAIDILFLDASLCVIALFQHVKPNRILPYVSSHCTVELLAGQSEEKGIQPGVKLHLEEGQVLLEFALIISVFVIALAVIFPLFSDTISQYIQSIWDFVTDL